ncbi:hypothetical protein VNO78_28811 [Psophocarpus tetragonolobus]|uniref:Trimethylguanosine synthase n=1 Tax=Psophocarpus tetragonolobus TaxID=3891 RepID=A0AAN9RTT8_PSOTE
MVIADSDYEGPAIQALGSLFKVTQVFLWDDSSSAERTKLAEADLLDVITPQDLELTRQLSELGLPLSFQTNKKKSGPTKGKKKGVRSKHPDTCQNSVHETLYEVSGEEIVSSAEFHDKASSSLPCMSLPGQSEYSYCEGAMDIDMTETQCAYGEGDNSACCTGFASGVSGMINNDNINQVATNDDLDGDFLISNDCVDLKTALASDTGVSAGSHLTDCETFYDDDVAVTCHPHAIKSELLPASSEVIGCDINVVSNIYAEHEDWMACWDTFYKRIYFYNIRTHTSTWEAPLGMEHMAIVGSAESDDSETVKASEECETQNNTKPPEETLIEENLDGIGVAVGNLVSDITTSSEDQFLDHSDECLVRSSCNDGVSSCSVSSTQDHSISSKEKCILAAPEVNHTALENMITDMFGLDTKSDPFILKQGKKVRRQRLRKLYNEAEDLPSQEMPEAYSAAIGKYWCQRYILFSRFDDGIKMDEEGWFSVTAEAIAQHQAVRCASGVIIDCFTGVGGNAIQFAQQCGHVIGIDIDPSKIDYAKHNAAIYGVDDQIDFIIGDFFRLAPKLKADTVFLSPPWGGPDYVKATTYDMKTMLRPHDGHTLFNVAKEIASRIVMFLPRNINFNQLAELSLSSCPPWSLEVEKVYLNNKLKAITAYFSDSAHGEC